MPTCRSCNAAIVFAQTTGGKAAPFESDPAGEWAIGDDGVARNVGKAPDQLELGSNRRRAPRYTSHFARCKDAANWRRR